MLQIAELDFTGHREAGEREEERKEGEKVMKERDGENSLQTKFLAMAFGSHDFYGQNKKNILYVGRYEFATLWLISSSQSAVPLLEKNTV